MSFTLEHWHVARRLPKGLIKLGTKKYSKAEKASEAADKERPDRKCQTCGHNSTSFVVVGCNGDSERTYFIDGWYKIINFNCS